MRTVYGELPFEPEVPLDACVRVRGDDRDEERAVVNFPADFPVPGLTSPKLALVEPDLDSSGAQTR